MKLSVQILKIKFYFEKQIAGLQVSIKLAIVEGKIELFTRVSQFAFANSKKKKYKKVGFNLNFQFN